MFLQTMITRTDDPVKELNGEYPMMSQVTDVVGAATKNCANQGTQLKKSFLPVAIEDILSSLTEVDNQFSSPIFLDGICET